VVANEALRGRSLADEVRSRAGPSTQVLVVAPALDSHAPRWSSAQDAQRAEASLRIDEAVAALLAVGVEARGTVGDVEPLRAIDHALRTFDADEILVATESHDESDWLDRGVVAQARERFPVPVVHLVVDLEHQPAPGG
jgi:GABA permease